MKFDRCWSRVIFPYQDPPNSRLQLNWETEEKDPALQEVVLPNGLNVFAHDKGETELIYEEIWTYDSYFQCDKLKLEPGATVLDVGGNTGLFSLYAKQDKCNNDATIYAFEPIPSTYRILKANGDRHFDAEQGNAKFHALNYGLSSKDGEITFWHHPHQCGWTTSDKEMDEKRNQDLYQNLPTITDEIVKKPENWWLRWFPRSLVLWGARQFAHAMVKTQPITCQVRTLSSVIDEYKISNIDLVKVDVEGAELDVLQGIRDDHWPRIQQFTMEVEGHTLKPIQQLLTEKGFVFEHEYVHKVQQAFFGVEAEIFYLWAWRQTAQDK
ncbi:Inherit from NOG: Methyltransferase [Seminavis robusta]|uniref:Inherit from NOG: Methyltransferase n=1 Tax=Seminavis robusta TaxID=568900 RepID=A0A9N8F261_9STRA|nr:Inherit from NOG: Methyltransferase [Seminavis robusta]|eukprot:Sro3408_g347690.1 Inherit from NOG: Methyltransferase (325) ;mRNA; f:469-1532